MSRVIEKEGDIITEVSLVGDDGKRLADVESRIFQCVYRHLAFFKRYKSIGFPR